MIYFVTAREIGRVKIGFSDEPRSRFGKMRTDSPVPLALERVTEGDVDVERHLHAKFAAFRLNGEWFALSAEIEAYMGTLTAVPERSRKPLAGAFGRWLVANKITLTEAALALGSTQTTMSRICSGVHEPTFAMMMAIFQYTNGDVSPSDIVFEWPVGLPVSGIKVAAA